LAWLEAERPDPWVSRDRMTQDDVAFAIVVTFLKRKPPAHFDAGLYPALDTLNLRCEALPAFRAAPFMEG